MLRSQSADLLNQLFHLGKVVLLRAVEPAVKDRVAPLLVAQERGRYPQHHSQLVQLMVLDHALQQEIAHLVFDFRVRFRIADAVAEAADIGRVGIQIAPQLYVGGLRDPHDGVQPLTEGLKGHDGVSFTRRRPARGLLLEQPRHQHLHDLLRSHRGALPRDHAQKTRPAAVLRDVIDGGHQLPRRLSVGLRDTLSLDDAADVGTVTAEIMRQIGNRDTETAHHGVESFGKHGVSPLLVILL